MSSPSTVAKAQPSCLNNLGVGKTSLSSGQIDFNGAEISASGSGPNHTPISKLSLEIRITGLSSVGKTEEEEFISCS